MTLRPALPLAFALCLGFAAVPTLAQDDIYDNGPTIGDFDAWTINFGYVVSDSFDIPNGGATVNGITFASWTFPGVTLESAEVMLTSEEFGGTAYFDQSVNFTASDCYTNHYGYNVCNQKGSFPGVFLNGGTYWLTLQNGVTNTGDPVYWDENSGPSSASGNAVGTMPSEAFTILGNTNTGTGPGTTPEPSSLLLVGSGVLGIGGLVRRRLH